MPMTRQLRAPSAFAASCLALLGACHVASRVQTPAAGGVPRAFGPPAALPAPPFAPFHAWMTLRLG